MIGGPLSVTVPGADAMIRAFVFDIYDTLLEVGPAPPDAQARWLSSCQALEPNRPALSLSEFDLKCQDAIALAREAAKAAGTAFPEVYWPDIARAALPSLGLLSEADLDQFLYAHARMVRAVRLMPGADQVLAELLRRGALIGLCSNCQPYTLRELAQALAPAGLSMDIFDPQLCFYSFQAGLCKPDPGPFRMLKDALAARSVCLADALYAGDRLDKDIRPAQSEGWRTWHLSAAPEQAMGGDWFRLLEFVRSAGSLRWA